MRTASVALAMALGIGMLAWCNPARGDVAQSDFASMLPPTANPLAQGADPIDWFPAPADSAIDLASHPSLKTKTPAAAARETEFTAPTAPLPSALYAGIVGSIVVAWSIHRVKRRGWI